MANGTILVADDDAAIRTVLNQALGRAGYEVRVTGQASTLWRWISEGQGDLVVTDVVMPGGIDGMQLARIATQHRRDLRVLLTSGFPASSAAMETLDDRMPQLLMKPYRTSELAERVRRALHARP